jgi:hypothetical protein
MIHSFIILATAESFFVLHSNEEVDGKINLHRKHKIN